MTCFKGYDFGMALGKTPRTIWFVDLYILRNKKIIYNFSVISHRDKLRIHEYGLLHRRKFASFKINLSNVDNVNYIQGVRLVIPKAKATQL